MVPIPTSLHAKIAHAASLVGIPPGDFLTDAVNFYIENNREALTRRKEAHVRVLLERELGAVEIKEKT